MKVTVERIPDSQVLLNIEIDQERVESSIDQAYKRIAPRTRIPGFRPGKAPRALVERHYGREALLHEALDRLVPAVVQEAIEAESLEIVDRPDLEIASLDPVVVKATVPVRPTIELGDYRAVRVEREPVTVEAERIDETLENLRQRYATVEPVDRPVQEGDIIRADIRMSHDGNVLDDDEDIELTVRDEELAEEYPGLYPKLLGLTAGETHMIDVIAPERPAAEDDATDVDASADQTAGESDEDEDEDDEFDLAGKMLSYTVTIKDVKAQTLPELNDEFAQQVGEGFPTLAALRERLETDMRERLDAEADRKLEDDALTKMLEGATVEFPPQIVDREVERMLREQGVPGEDRKSFEQFLRRVGQSEAQLKEIFRPAATERVRRSLVLSRIREREGIAVSADDVEAELASMGAGSPQAEQIRQIFDTEMGRESIERTLLTRRTLERVRQIALGEAPSLPEPAAEAEPSASVVAAESTTAASEPSAPDAAGQAAPNVQEAAEAASTE